MPSSHGPASALPIPENSVATMAPIRADFSMHSPRLHCQDLMPRGFLPARRMPRHGELGLDDTPKLATRALFGSDCIRTGLQLLFDAFSSCEPVPTSLENAMVLAPKN